MRRGVGRRKENILQVKFLPARGKTVGNHSCVFLSKNVGERYFGRTQETFVLDYNHQNPSPSTVQRDSGSFSPESKLLQKKFDVQSSLLAEVGKWFCFRLQQILSNLSGWWIRGKSHQAGKWPVLPPRTHNIILRCGLHFLDMCLILQLGKNETHTSRISSHLTPFQLRSVHQQLDLGHLYNIRNLLPQVGLGWHLIPSHHILWDACVNVFITCHSNDFFID